MLNKYCASSCISGEKKWDGRKRIFCSWHHDPVYDDTRAQRNSEILLHNRLDTNSFVSVKRSSKQKNAPIFLNLMSRVKFYVRRFFRDGWHLEAEALCLRLMLLTLVISYITGWMSVSSSVTSWIIFYWHWVNYLVYIPHWAFVIWFWSRIHAQKALLRSTLPYWYFVDTCIFKNNFTVHIHDILFM